MFFFTLLLFCVISLQAGSAFFLAEYGNEHRYNIERDIIRECQELKREQFIAISLGENCFPALHLREHKLRIRSFPFDWNITPFSALYAILENDFEGFFDLSNLAINQKENTVYNKRYQFKLNHDFDIRDWAEGPMGLTPKNNQSLEKYKLVCSYYQRRIKRFYKAFELAVPVYLFRRVISAAQAKKLYRLLKLKFPKSNFTLVCIQDEKWEQGEPWNDMPEGIVHYRVGAPISHKFGERYPQVTQLLHNLELI